MVFVFVFVVATVFAVATVFVAPPPRQRMSSECAEDMELQELIPSTPRQTHDGSSTASSSSSYSDLLASFEASVGVVNMAHTGKGSLLTSTVNLTNTIVGGGMLALPFAFKSAGLLLGMLMLAAVIVTTDFSVRLLHDAGVRTRRPLFRPLTERTLGPRVVPFVQICIILQSYGTCIGYYVIIADMVQPLLAEILSPDSPFASRTFVGLVSLAVTAPLVCLSSLAALRHTSLAAVGAIAFLVAAVATRAGPAISSGTHEGSRAAEHVPSAPIVWVEGGPHIALAVPIFAFAYSCHFNVPAIIAELERPTRSRVLTFVRSALGIVSSVYLAVSVLGYLTFRGDVEGNLLNSYPSDDYLIDTARVALALVVTFSVPLMIHPSRVMLEQLLFPNSFGNSFVRPRVIALSLVSFAFLISVLVSDISVVFGLVGSTVTPIVSYLLPAAFFLSAPSQPLSPNEKVKRWGAYAVFVGGVIIMIVATTVNIVTIAQDDRS